MRFPGALLAISILVALAVGGCGGGDEDDTTAAAPVETTEAAALSKEELLAQGDAICAEVNAAVGAAGSTSADAGEAVVQTADLYDGMVERLEGLGPPSDESGGYAEFISTADQLVQAEKNVKLAYEREETEALEEGAAEVRTALADFQAAAREFGFENCSKAPAAPAPGGSGEEAGGEESAGGVEPEAEAEEAAPEEEAEAAPEEEPPAEEESPGGGAGVGGGGESGGGSGGGSSGGIGPG